MCLMPPPMMPPPPGPLLLPESRVGPEESWGVLFIRGPRSAETKRGTGEENEVKGQMKEETGIEESIRKRRSGRLKIKNIEFKKQIIGERRNSIN